MRIETPVTACDVCERFATDTTTWFVVTRNGDSIDACSTNCLSKLGRQIAAAEAGQPAPRPQGRPPKANHTTPNEDPCKVCGEVIPTKQGLGAHLFRAHAWRKNADGVMAPV